MLCAAPAAEAGEDKPAGKQEEKQEEEKLEEKQEKPKQDKPKQAAAKAAIPAAAATAATPERRSSPRRAKRNSQKSPTTPTLMDVWVSGGSTQLCNGMKIKTEKMATPAATPVRRSSPRRALAQEMESQVAMTPMSPALFEIPTTTTPSVAAAAGTKSYSADDSKTVNGSSTSPGLRSDSDGITMDIAATCIDETQLEIVDLTQQTESSRRQQPVSEADKNIEEPMQEQTPTRRRRSAYDANEGDGSPDETQLEQVELTQQTPTRRRKSATDAMQDKTGLESVESQTKTTPRTRRRNATDETHLNGNGQTPTPRKRRRSASNSVAINDNSQMVTAEPKQQSLSNGKVALTNGSAETSSLPVQSHEQPLPEVEIFQVGDLVEVIERQWVGINKRGGAGRIVKVHGDGFYAVKFLIGTGTDHRVPGSFIRRPAEDIVSDSTPSRAVRKRQRRRPSDVMASPDLLTVKTRSSPHSIEKTKSKTVSKSKTKGKSSGMVFLCSGFKEDRMRQIDKWADMLGAEVVQYWSNHVTHLIVKCVSGGMEDEGHSMEDSDSATSPQGHKDGKRKLFSDSKLGRWVKIRSLKYLKALVGGRWIVSDEWLEGKTV
ncbi:unnamed protein product [Phytophthora lilii]|uniref:Unnamed protein product n=1 Tax=Phytophthora lilii TaxID=2077276 RepID=A0A9W6TDF6_9STRA|nr:unnamed protein product [Phytophthora lilii]